jgi:hypothetical protein
MRKSNFRWSLTWSISGAKVVADSLADATFPFPHPTRLPGPRQEIEYALFLPCSPKFGLKQQSSCLLSYNDLWQPTTTTFHINQMPYLQVGYSGNHKLSLLPKTALPNDKENLILLVHYN